MRRLTRRQQLSAITLAVLALLFISLDFAGGSLGRGPRRHHRRARLAVPGHRLGARPGSPVPAGDSRCRTEPAARSPSCSNRIVELQRQLAAAGTDAATARRLSALQLQADSEQWQIMPARVIATGPGAGFQWTVTLDAGSREHVQAGQSVTDGVGLVGRVVAVYPTTSVVLLAADPTSGVGVRDVRSGAAAAGHRPGQRRP